MASPDIFTATDGLSVGVDNLETFIEAIGHGREGLVGNYPGYAYTNALAMRMRQHGNPVLAMEEVKDKGYYNYRNIGEAFFACFKAPKDSKIKPGDPRVPLEHGAFFGNPDNIDRAIKDWSDPDKRPTVRLIYDAELDPGPIKFKEMLYKLRENSRVKVELIAVHTPQQLIAELVASQLHVGEGPVVNIVGIHGDLREPGQTGADLYVGGFEEKNKVDTKQVLAATKDTMTCFISCYGSKVFEPHQNGKNKTSDLRH